MKESDLYKNDFFELASQQNAVKNTRKDQSRKNFNIEN